MKRTLWITGLAIAFTIGCGEKPGDENGDTNGTTNGTTNGATNGETNGAPNGMTNGATNGVTNGATNGETNGMTGVYYYEDAAPIFKERCWGCHTEGGIGPFALDDYDIAKDWAAAIKTETQARRMPPQQVVADGTCNDWREPGWLTDDELATIAAWADGGALAGDPENMPSPRDPDPTLENPDLVVEIPEVYEPVAAGTQDMMFDDYRCFVIDPEQAEDQFITSYEVVPGNDEIVHHVLLFTVDFDQVVGQDQNGPITNSMVVAGHEAANPDRLGYPCAPLAGDNVVISGLPVVWAPGQGVIDYPDDTGLFFGGGQMLIMQVHYNLASATGTDQTQIKLRLEDSVSRTSFIDLRDDFLASSYGPNPETLPPGEANVPVEWDNSVDGMLDQWGSAVGATLPYVDVYGWFPHMHETGRTLQTTLSDGSTDVCMGEVDQWDFNWQYFYWYQEPVRLERGMDQTVTVNCGFDTTSRDDATYPGFGTSNEMCLIGLYVALP